MKLLLRRAAILLFFSLLVLVGLVIFTWQYVNNSSTWVQHPANRHLYANGKPINLGTIYDRAGRVLLQMIDGSMSFHGDKTVRTAVMHATGDMHNNVETSAQMAFPDRLSGWNIINGIYRLKSRSGSGSNLTLTLDAELCAAAYEELSGRKGTVGIYNYQTGEILCMVSAPSFDPENPPDIDADPEKYEGVYINRLLSAVYTPGSVFKLVTAAAAIENIENIEEKRFYCDGKLQIGGDLVTCMSAHGEISLSQALASSCNVAFGQLSLELGPEKLQRYAELAGFNSSLEVNGIKTAAGRVELADAKDVELAWAGIGQYTNTANPLNFMAYMGAIANDGLLVNPRILRERRVLSFVNASAGENKQIFSPDTAKKLKALIRESTLSIYGEDTMRGLGLCAKSGTAEVGGGKRPHAWFAGFLDSEEFPFAFVVVIENGGFGSRVAAPVALKVLQAAVNSF
ncbi:MAG: penicillin-binding transpeptidase domain-containing protein [Dethiobacteria bacterium]|nr:penicillin-binding protein [Alcaligenaceae bacterium]NLC51524.1 penicillin-binding protein [Bacillota bacterium]